MNCPICSGDTTVLHRAPDKAKRRRKCVRCGHRFNTIERMEVDVVRQDEVVKHAEELVEKLKAA